MTLHRNSKRAVLTTLFALWLLSGCGLFPERAGARAQKDGQTIGSGSTDPSPGPGTASNSGNQGGEANPTGYTDARYHYRITGPGPLKAQSDGTASFAGEDERLEVAIVEGAKAADPAALAEADLSSLSRSTADFQVLFRPDAVTLGGQRVIKFTYSSSGKGHTGKSIKLFNVRYYIPKSDTMLAVVSYRDAASEFDAKEADGFASSFRWL